MSDATLPPNPLAATALSGDDGNRSDSSHNAGDSDASLIHSSDPADREEGIGSVEGKVDNKQKRKRTSPRDQGTLESEYKKNPKPNKAARAIIVEMVDMNEKEVQIWFQNRRQINRRKSRPLLPHEIVAFGIGGIAALSSDPVVGMPFSSSSTSGEEEARVEVDKTKSSQEREKTHLPEQRLEVEEPITNDDRVEIAKEATEMMESSEPSLPPSKPYVPSLERQPSSTGSLVNAESSSFSSVIKSFSSTPGYLANRWNAVSSFTSSRPESSQATGPFMTPSISYPALPKSCPERVTVSDTPSSSSRVRLSMSIDGKAELVETLSSPPRPLRRSSSTAHAPKPRRGLQRSQSARQSSYQLPPIPFVPTLTSGRSRDARAWEFCCDPQAQELAQDELTTQATNESTGSAVAAISLLRSTSNAALKTNNNKRNAPSARQDTGSLGKKAKLGRAASSLARLQSTVTPPTEQVKAGEIRTINLGSPTGDSDKENWLPGEKGIKSRRRPLPSSRSDLPSQAKTILGDNNTILSHAVDLGGSKIKKRKAAPHVTPEVFEDEENREPGEEVERFMRGEISPSKKGDYNAIQGLLSLSQGNWR